jgi:hypothetical protein
MTEARVEVQLVDTLDRLLALRAEWDEVQDACPEEHVFLDHRFCAHWWRAWGSGKEMHTLLLRRDGVIEGIVPLVLSRGWEAYPTSSKSFRIADDFRYLPNTRWRRFVPIRRLTFPLNFPSSNIRSHFLLRRDDPRLIEAVLGYCASIRSRWDILCLEGVPVGSEQERVLEDLLRCHGMRESEARNTRGFLRTSLPESMSEFLGKRSANFRRSLKRARRQNEDAGAPHGGFRVVEYRGESIDAGMDRLFELEKQSWKVGRSKRRELHLRLDDTSRGFHREVARAFARDDEAQVLVSEVGGTATNALYSLERNGLSGCVLTYQSEEWAQRTSVASLWERFFELAIERGLQGVDLNGSNSYLARYAESEERFRRFTLYSSRPYSALLRLIGDGATRLGRRLRGREESGSDEMPAR